MFKFWKNWPYWVKGSIFFVLVYVCYAILVNPGQYWDGIIYSGHFPGVMSLTVSDMENLFTFGRRFSTVDIIAVNISWYLIIGAAAGWLYGKIKSRRFINPNA